MRLNEIREIFRPNTTRKVNGLSKKNSHPDRRNFSRYLNGENKKDSSLKKKSPDLLKNKDKGKIASWQSLDHKEDEEKNKSQNNGKGKFIDVRV